MYVKPTMKEPVTLQKVGTHRTDCAGFLLEGRHSRDESGRVSPV